MKKLETLKIGNHDLINLYCKQFDSLIQSDFLLCRGICAVVEERRGFHQCWKSNRRQFGQASSARQGAQWQHARHLAGRGGGRRRIRLPGFHLQTRRDQAHR